MFKEEKRNGQGSAMPAKNIYHDVVLHALLADGWTITHDPLTISYGGRDLFVDLGAERPAVSSSTVCDCASWYSTSRQGASVGRARRRLARKLLRQHLAVSPAVSRCEGISTAIRPREVQAGEIERREVVPTNPFSPFAHGFVAQPLQHFFQCQKAPPVSRAYCAQEVLFVRVNLRNLRRYSLGDEKVDVDRVATTHRNGTRALERFPVLLPADENLIGVHLADFQGRRGVVP